MHYSIQITVLAFTDQMSRRQTFSSIRVVTYIFFFLYEIW